MKVMKLAVVGVAALAVAAAGLCAVYGPTTMRAQLGLFQKHAKDLKSDELLMEEIKIELKDMEDRIVAHETSLRKVERKIAPLAEDVKALTGKRDENLAILRKAKDLLGSESDTFTVADRKVSREDLTKDASKRVAEVKLYDEQIKVKTAMIHSLQSSVAEANGVLVQAKELRKAKMFELGQLAQRLENAKRLAEVKELTKDLDNSPLKATGVVSGNWEQLKDRLTELEIRNDGVEKGTAEPINWKKEVGSDALKEIDDLFKAREATDDKAATAAK